jgi:hypothetical protein
MAPRGPRLGFYPSLRRTSFAGALGVSACGSHQSTPPESSPSVVAFSAPRDGGVQSKPEPEAQTVRVNEHDHCEALTRIAIAMDLFPGTSEPLVARETPEIGDLYEKKFTGAVVPSGFDICTLEWPRRDGISTHYHYTCRTRPVALVDDAFAKLSGIWRECFVPPAWTPAARVTYAGGDGSALAQCPDAYISSHFIRLARDSVWFSEGYCVLNKARDFVEMTCGHRTNN